MNTDFEIVQRIATLEAELRHEREARRAEVADLEAALAQEREERVKEIAPLKRYMSSMNKLAGRVGTFWLGVIALGIFMGYSVEAIKEKLVALIRSMLP